jgi:hypothetical protein
VTAFDEENVDIFGKIITEKCHPVFYGGPLQDSRFLDIPISPCVHFSDGLRTYKFIYQYLNVSMLDMS